MKRKIIFSVLILAMLFSSFLAVPTQALFDEKECVLAMDMEQMFVLPKTGGYGSYQDTYLFDVSPWRNHGELLPYGAGNPVNATDYQGALKELGYYGYGMAFDGVDDYVNVRNDLSLNVSYITMMAWINLDSHPSGLYTVIGKWYVSTQPNDRGYILQVYNYSGGTKAHVSLGAESIDVSVTGTSNLTLNTWYHICATYDGTTIILYVDGVQENNSTSLTGTIDGINRDLFIGGEGSGNPTPAQNWFNGTLDDIRIYPLALTNAEINQDIITPVDQYYSQDFLYYYNNVTWSEDPTSGMHGHFQGDPWCPWVNSDGVEDAFRHEDVQIRYWSFVPGFQQFRFRGTFFTNFTKATGGGNRDGFDFHWYFFKDGLWNSYYRVSLNRVKPQVGDDHQWWISIGYLPREGNYGYIPLITVNTTQAGNDIEWDWCVDGFVSQDGSQFVIRVTSENKTHAWDLGYGEGWELDRYHVERRWDLVDAEGSSQHVEWFDSFVGIEFKCSGRYKNGTVAVLRHRAGIIGNFIKRVYEVVRGAIDRFIVPVVKMVTSIELPSLPTPEIVTGVLDAWKRGILDLPHKLYEGFTNVVTGIQNAFSGIGQIMYGLSSTMAYWFQQMSINLSTGLILVWDILVLGLDTIFGWIGYPGAFTTLTTFLASFWTWLVTGVGYAVTLLTSTFLVMASWLTFGITRFTSIATGFVNIYTVLVDIWTQANTGWLSITSWLTPMLPLLPLCIFIWIFSVKDLEGMVKRVSMLWNLLSTTIIFLVKMGEFAINTIYGLIELVPVAE